MLLFWILIFLLVLAVMFVGMPFLIIGVMYLFGIDVGYVPALVTYLAISFTSTVLFSGTKK